MSTPAGDSLVQWVPRLRRYAYTLLGHADDADDLVQSTLERAWIKSSHWSRVKDMRAWLFTLMHNLYVDEARCPRLRQMGIEDREWAALDVVSPQEARAALLDLDVALAHLPAAQKEVLLLVTLEDMSYAEVAQMLDIPIGTVMSRLSRARKRLRVLMDGDSAPAAALRRVK